MFKAIAVAYFLFSILIFTQEESYYQQAVIALKAGDTTSAKELLKLSIRREKISDANYELAKIYSEENTTDALNKGRRVLNDVIKWHPDKVNYRLLMAEMHKKAFKINIFDKDALSRAEGEYNEVLKVDYDNEKAHFELAKLYERKFYEFVYSEILFLDLSPMKEGEMYGGNTARISENDFKRDLHSEGSTATLSFSERAEEFFNSTLNHLLNTIRLNTKNADAVYRAAMLFSFDKNYPKAIEIIDNAEVHLPKNYKLKLAKAHAFHKLNKFKLAQEYFDKAFSLMNKKERNEFKLQSVMEIVQPSFKEKLKSKTNLEVEKILYYFWKIKDPLNLTKQNERLLEHYSRMVYADYYLSDFDPYVHNHSDVEIKGWKSERGKIFLRYGSPKRIIRFRPKMKGATHDNLETSISKSKVLFSPNEFLDKKIDPDRDPRNYKTEVWQYDDFELSFVDMTNRKNYKLDDDFAGVTFESQYRGDSKKLSDDLMLSLPNDYKPDHLGSNFELDFDVFQFRGNNSTDVYVSYAIDADEINNENSKFKEGLTYGLFFFDKYMNLIFEKRDTLATINTSSKLIIDDDSTLAINSIVGSITPQEGNFSFETLRNFDRGVFSTRGKYIVKNFSNQSLQVSDLILASDIKANDAKGTTIQRGEYYILPNPVSIFSEKVPLHLFFEIYNLQKNESGLTNFEQRITIREKEDDVVSDILNSLGDIIGINDEGEKITLSSNYSTLDKDQKISLKLDMSDYGEGEYIIQVTIKDNITGKETTSTADFTWNY